MQSVAGVIYPVDVQSLVIRGIVAIHIGTGVMDNSMDVWSLVQSVMAMTQCLLQLDLPAAMTNSGRSFSTANLWITIFHFFWKHLQFGYSDLQRIVVSGIQYFTGDVSGMPFSIFSFMAI